MEQGTSKGQALLHAAREHAHWRVPPVSEANLFQSGCDPYTEVRKVVRPTIKSEVLDWGEVRVEEALMTKKAKPPPHCGIVWGAVKEPQGST